MLKFGLVFFLGKNFAALDGKRENKLSCLLLHCRKRCYVPDIICNNGLCYSFSSNMDGVPVICIERDKEKVICLAVFSGKDFGDFFSIFLALSGQSQLNLSITEGAAGHTSSN